MTPKGGNVNIKTPQSTAGSPRITRGGVNPSASGGKIVGGLKKNPSPGSAPRPSTSGRKIQTKIQTGTPASRTK